MMVQRGRMVVARGWGEGEVGIYCFMGIEFQSCKQEKQTGSRNWLHNGVTVLNSTVRFKW